MPDDDANHLRLLARVDSGASNTLRYAYARLDTIDRKSSEIFRAHTFLFAAVLTAFSLSKPNLDAHHPTLANGFIAALMVLLIVVTVVITVIHMNISSLRFYRVPNARAILSEAPTDKVFRLDDVAFNDYLKTVSSTTSAREESLQRLRGFFWAALLLETFIALLLFVHS